VLSCVAAAKNLIGSCARSRWTKAAMERAVGEDHCW
jgi:hypothetical protein